MLCWMPAFLTAKGGWGTFGFAQGSFLEKREKWRTRQFFSAGDSQPER